MANPVKYVDPDGRKIKTTNDNLPLITSTLSSAESKYVNLDDNGFIDVNLLKTGAENIGNVGGNYLSLLEIAVNEKIVEFSAPLDQSAVNGNNVSVSGNDVNFPFRDPINDEYTNGEYEMVGGLGVTLAPKSHKWTKHDQDLRDKLPAANRLSSNNSNYQVQVNGRGLKHKSTYKTLVETTAHELYGHLLMMFRGKDALHSPVRYGEGSNVGLENQIRESENEAINNYESGN
jgi:hypothetical protein